MTVFADSLDFVEFANDNQLPDDVTVGWDDRAHLLAVASRAPVPAVAELDATAEDIAALVREMEQILLELRVPGIAPLIETKD